MASTTSRTWNAIDSSVARAMWAPPLPRVMPRIAPRASGSQYGAPRPTNAGTTTTPPLSVTDAASPSTSLDSANRPRPSRSHWTAAPVTNTEPSSAWTIGASGPSRQRIVDSSPLPDRMTGSPVLTSRNAPVPSVTFASPGSKQAWPNVAACWSPAAPAIGIGRPNRSASVSP
jgi:hypothetical protein